MNLHKPIELKAECEVMAGVPQASRLFVACQLSSDTSTYSLNLRENMLKSNSLALVTMVRELRADKIPFGRGAQLIFQ